MHRPVEAQHVGQRRRFGQGEGGNAGADQQRRDGDVQTVERAGGEKARHGDAAALDEHAPQTARRESGEHGGDRQPLARARQAQHRRVADAILAGRIRRAEQQRLRALAEHAVARVEAAVGVEHDAHRRRAFDLARGELRVVGAHRAGADHHGIEQRAQAMRMDDVLVTADPVRGTAGGGDAAVQRLRDPAEDVAAVRGGGWRQQRAVERRQRGIA